MQLLARSLWIWLCKVAEEMRCTKDLPGLLSRDSWLGRLLGVMAGSDRPWYRRQQNLTCIYLVVIRTQNNNIVDCRKLLEGYIFDV
ncbi:hypothetical protein SEVIR_6G108715v4 [Setaria viridis]